MPQRLTKKQRKFVNRYADTGNATLAVKEAGYDVANDLTARVIGSENLTKPNIIEELRILGFDSNNAKRVVGQILNSEDQDSQHRLNAADKIFKVNGDYAPEKNLNINIDANSTERTRELGTRIVGLFRRGN